MPDVPSPTLPLAQLAWIQVAAMLLPYGVLLVNDFDDLDAAAAGMFALALILGPVVAVLHGWVVARLDRRLLGPSRSRLWALPQGLGVTLAAHALPVTLHATALATAGLVTGRWRWVARAAHGLPSAVGLVGAAGLLLWAARLRRQRVPLPDAPRTIGDLLPTSWVWGGWWMASWGFAAGVVSAAASEASLGAGLAWIGAWVGGSVAASLAVARAARALPTPRFADRAPLAEEAAGATAVGSLVPLFLFGLVPMWHGNDDIRWALLLTTLVVVPGAVWIQARGRLARRA